MILTIGQNKNLGVRKALPFSYLSIIVIKNRAEEG